MIVTRWIETAPGKLGAMTSSRPNAIARAGPALLRTRWFVRAPIWLYRTRLGFLFGSRFLMLEHVGRKSRLTRYVVLEVVDRPAPGRYVVVSGFGEQAQWLRNVDASPSVRVQIGSRKPTRATAHRLDPEASAASLSRFASAHPRAWAKVRPVLEHTLGARIDENGRQLPAVALDTVGAAL